MSNPTSPAYRPTGSYGRLHSPHRRFDLSLLPLGVELVFCTLSMTMGLLVFLPSILRSQERTLRFQLIIGLSCSDFLLAVLSFFETIVTLTGKHPGTGSTVCNVTGFLTSTFVFAQYLWAIAMASATFLLLRHPMSAVTEWCSRNWGMAWVIFYAISFAQAGVWWAKSGYELSGGFCYYGSRDQRWGDLLQLVCRGSVLVIVSALYANLFLFLRRPTIGTGGRPTSKLSSRRQSANTRHSSSADGAGQGDDHDDRPPWERVNFSTFTLTDDQAAPDCASHRSSGPPSPKWAKWTFTPLGRPSLSEVDSPLRPDLQVDIPFREPASASPASAPASPRQPWARTLALDAPVFSSAFNFGGRPSPRADDLSPRDQRADPLARTPPRRSSLAQHRRAVSDATPSPPRKVSFSCNPLGPATDADGDFPQSARSTESASPSLFAGFAFAASAPPLVEAPSTTSAVEPSLSDLPDKLQSCPAVGVRGSSLPNALSAFGPTAGPLAGRSHLQLPPSSLRRSSLPTSSLDPVVPFGTFSSASPQPSDRPNLPRRTSLVAQLTETGLARSRRSSLESAITAVCDDQPDKGSPTYKMDRLPSATRMPVLNRLESDSSAGSSETIGGSSTTATTHSAGSLAPLLKTTGNNPSTSSTGSTRIKALALIGLSPPDLSTSSQSTLIHPDLASTSTTPNSNSKPPRPSSMHARARTPLTPGRDSSDTERNLPDAPSKATYMRRKASQLMIYLPTAYLFMFVVFAVRFGVDLEEARQGIGRGSGRKGGSLGWWVRAVSRWVLVGQGVINGAIYGIVEHRARRSIQQLEAADEQRRRDEERQARDAELVALALERVRVRERSEDSEEG